MLTIGPSWNSPPSSLVNASPQNAVGCNYMPGTSVNSGALTADTYPGTAQIVITGAGVLNFLGFYSADATARNVTTKIVLDGTQVLEVLIASGAQYQGGAVVGAFIYGGATVAAGIAFDQIPFFTSLSIFSKSSVSETNKHVIKYVARLI